MSKKQSKSHKLTRRWLPTNRTARLAVIGLFVAAVSVFGYIAIKQSFAYSSYFKYYSQKDPAWANSPYPYKPGTRDQSDIKMSLSGCGPTAMAMVASSLSRSASPPDVAKWYGGRYHSSGGTEPAVYPVFAKDYGLKYASLGNFHNGTTRKAIQDTLKAGRTLVIVHAGPGYFTKSGHILVIRDYNPKNGQYLVADPNNSGNNRWFIGINLVNANLTSAYSFTR